MAWTARALSFAVVVGFVISQTGCGSRYGNNTCLGDNCNNASTPNAVCLSDSDCPAQQYCSNTGCVDTPNQPTSTPTDAQKPVSSTACTQVNDCPAGMFCHLARKECVQCLNDDACPAAEVCLSNGSCGAPNTGCTAGACGNLVCDNESGRCVQCLQNTDCPSGQTCKDKACASNNTCTSDNDCALIGRICDLSTQKCVPCSTDTQCGSGKRCSAGICTTSGGGTGNGGGIPNVPNPIGGNTCLSSQDCGGQACFLGTCTPCFMDEMCMDFTSLFTGALNICNPETGQCTQPQCSSAYDCAAGQGCYGNGHCGACSSDEECRTSERCNTSTGVCAAPAPTAPATPTPPSTTVLGDMGSACVYSTDCMSGLFCLGSGSTGFCTRMCIGSGGGSTTDCPSGNACVNMTASPWDGLSVCMAPHNLSTDYPGRPFTQSPGSSCLSGNACQTAICYSDTSECARTCRANRDCAAGEVCWDAWSDTEMLGVQVCSGSDTFSFLAQGARCTSGAECDSGVCAGTCSGTQNPCNSNSDCSSGTCSGTCTNHCRTQSDCTTQQRCAPWAAVLANNSFNDVTMVCLTKPGSGTVAEGGSCSTHTQCRSGWCMNGSCTQTCALNTDCTGALSNKRCLPAQINPGVAQNTYAVGLCL